MMQRIVAAFLAGFTAGLGPRTYDPWNGPGITVSQPPLWEALPGTSMHGPSAAWHHGKAP